ncbi:SDR family oxidoreductase [Candidatus Latescibacterota bacterium]
MKQYKDVTYDFSGKVAIITGASSGIFQGVAKAYGEAGAKVALTSNKNTAGCEETKRLIEQAGGEAKIYTCDVADVSQIEKTVAAVIEDFGKIDVLVNGAGVLVRSKSEEVAEEDWDFVMDVQCKGSFFFCKEVGGHMLKRGEGGKIINTSSMLAFNGGYTVASYAAAKGAVSQFTKALCNEWAGQNINVNAVAPGYVVTRVTKPLFDDPVRGPQITSRISCGRWATPEDMAGPFLFLGSDSSNYMHGTIVPVDGGWLAR